jgi:hypothetical protein
MIQSIGADQPPGPADRKSYDWRAVHHCSELMRHLHWPSCTSFCSPDSQSGSPFQSPPALVIADRMPPLYAFEVAEVRLADLRAGLSRVADSDSGFPWVISARRVTGSRAGRPRGGGYEPRRGHRAADTRTGDSSARGREGESPLTPQGLGRSLRVPWQKPAKTFRRAGPIHGGGVRGVADRPPHSVGVRCWRALLPIGRETP